METSVSFKSELFQPVLPEDSQVNPGRYGAELAYYLCTELAKHQVMTSYPNYEDWGWFIEYITPKGDEFWLCCGNVDGESDQWHCFLQPKSRGFLRGTADSKLAMPLLEALRKVLEGEQSITDIKWE